MTDLMVNDFEPNEQMSTKRFTGISALTAESYLQERDTEKKSRKIEYVN